MRVFHSHLLATLPPHHALLASSHAQLVTQLQSLGHRTTMNPPFNVQWIDGWLDVTSDLDDPNAPWTFAKSNGVGALQFSIAEYKRGLSPNASPQVALSIIQNIASPETLTDVHITQGTNETPHIATGSFPQDDYTTQVWCITDGHNFCTATYTCLNDMHSNELAECEKMIQTFRFQPNQWPNQSLE